MKTVFLPHCSKKKALYFNGDCYEGEKYSKVRLTGLAVGNVTGE